MNTAAVVAVLFVVAAIVTIIFQPWQALLQRNANKQQAESEARARRANPTLSPTGISGGPTANPVVHNFLAGNGGPGTVTGLWIYFVDENGKTVAEAGGPEIVILPGQATAVMGLHVPQPLPREVTLWKRWKDGEGEHEESTGITRKPYAG